MAELCVQATFSVMLYNIYIVTDTLFVSKGVGSTASGAIGVFSPVLVFVGGISSTLGVGAGSIISRRLGEKDLTGGKTVIGCMVWVWFLCALAITVIGLFSSTHCSECLDVQPRFIHMLWNTDVSCCWAQYAVRDFQASCGPEGTPFIPRFNGAVPS